MMNSIELDRAFERLLSYDLGSSRAGLLAIEEVIRSVGKDAAGREKLETRLLDAIPSARSVAAREFIFNKLAWIGGAGSVDALAAFLGDAQLADAARNTLEALPSRETARAIRDRLAKLQGKLLAGAVGSLGALRDPDSVPALRGLLDDPDNLVAEAAAAALGRIGTPRAGQALLRRVRRTGVDGLAAVAHACLACAERLASGGDQALAKRLWRALAREGLPAPVRAAARRRLEGASS